jgi:transcriptional regulator with XRE-family HTH domain
VPVPEEVNAAVGRHVRAERARLAWTLDELAARSGVSKGMLHQIEQAKTNPSIGTIVRLATALGVTIASLVEAPEAPGARVVRADEAIGLWSGKPGSSHRLLVGSGTREQVELWDARLAPDDGYQAEAHPTGTRELLLVIDGELTMEIDGVPHLVGAGDAIAFVADRAHAYRNAGKTPVRFAMAVVIPARAEPPHAPPPTA